MKKMTQTKIENELTLEELALNKQQLRNKVIIFAVAGVLILAGLVYLGVAWYTRITTTHAVTFDVADYELAVNDNTENEFLVNVYDYSNVKEKTMAPGTAGYIPIRISGRHSEINVDYSVYFNNKMTKEMQDHIRFFYLAYENTQSPVILSLEYLNGSDIPTVVSADQNKFMKSPNELPDNTQKVYFSPFDITTGQPDYDDYTINGTLQMNSDKMIYIYWEWYLDAEDAAEKNSDIAKIKTDSSEADWAAYCEDWDALDTDMGKYPQKYHDAMFVHLTCSGVQSTPELEPR